MKKYVFFTFLFLCSISAYSQTINPEVELLHEYPVANDGKSLWFEMGHDNIGLLRVGNPWVDGQGRILLGNANDNWLMFHSNGEGPKQFMVFDPKTKINYLSLPDQKFGPGVSQQYLICQNGYAITDFFEIRTVNINFEIFCRSPLVEFEKGFTRSDIYCFTDFGIIIFTPIANEWKVFEIDYLDPNKKIVFYEKKALKKWLAEKHPELKITGFGQIQKDGVNLMPGIPYVSRSGRGSFMGVLKSGHALWRVGMTQFSIVNSLGDEELIIEDPDDQITLDFSIGPWGEFYLLKWPTNVSKNKREYISEPGKPATLSVVRNHLKYFGRTINGFTNLYLEPDQDSTTLRQYPEKSGFKIVNKTDKFLNQDGKKYFWFKVKMLDGKLGYILESQIQNLFDGPAGDPPPWPNVKGD